MPDNPPKWTPGPWVALSVSGRVADPPMIVATAPVWDIPALIQMFQHFYQTKMKGRAA